jgi:hypothetical protein
MSGNMIFKEKEFLFAHCQLASPPKSPSPGREGDLKPLPHRGRGLGRGRQVQIKVNFNDNFVFYG